jgi:hypothetical protein
MTVLHIEHPIRDFASWKAAFDSDPIGREQSGVRRYQVLQPVDDAHYGMIDLECASTDEASQGAAALRTLWAASRPRG